MQPTSPTAATTFVELLRQRAARHPGRIALQFLGDGETLTQEVSYAALDRHARSLAARLQRLAAPGDRVLLLYPSGPDYVVAFFACLYAGLIAVPAYPPEAANAQRRARIRAILRDCAPTLAMTDAASAPLLAAAGDESPLLPSTLSLLVTDVLAEDDRSAAWQPPAITPATLAFLQYTSGSTATPKGVMVSHGNLLANERALAAGMEAVEGRDKWLSWLPLFHDMGLIGGLLQPIYAGLTAVLMSPQHFMARPRRWLEAISRYRATISGAPDFAYRLCSERIPESALESLDLSSWRVAFCGAEPVRHASLSEFAQRFAKGGFDAGALYPCYGLAESTLYVSGGPRGGGLQALRCDEVRLAQGVAGISADGRWQVACGLVRGDHEVAIVDPATRERCAPGRVGEVWVQGPSVAQGYWQNAKATADSFHARLADDADDADNAPGFLRSGDLGFFHDDQLYIAGRCKDVIILRGQNLYPQDLEQTVEAAVPGLRRGRVSAFPVELSGEECIGLAAEVSPATLRRTSPEVLFQGIQRAVSQAWQETVGLILLLPPGELPKTTSGKLARSACRQGWQDGTLPIAASYRRDRQQSRDARLATACVAPVGERERRLAELCAEVLRLDRVGRDDHFFELGGDSLAAAQLLARLRQAWGVDLPLRTLFAAPTVAQLAALLDAQQRAVIEVPTPSPRRPAVLPLSYAQQRLWFLQQLEPGSSAYNIAVELRLSGALDVAALRQACDGLVARHEMLRSVFEIGDGQPRQRVLPPQPLELPLVDLRALDASTQAREVEQLRTAAAAKPFDLQTGPLLRLQLLQLADDEHHLLLVLHHIAVDGWSMRVLLRELASAYAAFREQRRPALAPLPLQYADYALWERDWLTRERLQPQLAWWRQQLGDEQPLLELPADRPRPAVASGRGARLTRLLPPTLAQRLRQLARREDATLFMLLLAAFQALLYRLSGQRDLRVAVPVSHRARPETEALIGFFINTLVLRAQPDGREPFAALLAQVKEAALGAQAHQDLPFEQLVEALQPQRSLSHAPLCQAKFVLQQDWAQGLALPGLELAVELLDEQQARFDLALDVTDTEQGLHCQFQYVTDLFDENTVQRLAGHWQCLLEGIAAQPGTALAQLPLLDADAQARLAACWRGPVDSASFRPLPELIAAHAAATPAAVALLQDVEASRHHSELPFALSLSKGERQPGDHPVGESVHASTSSARTDSGTVSISYAELERRANRLARLLQQQGVTAEQPVALCLPRSLDFVVAVLAVWKAGGYYVPLDPQAPPQRRQDQLADCGVRLLIGAGGLDLAAAADQSDAPLPVSLHPQQCAYLIYTSGSSGRPKGVAVSHGALANYLRGVLSRLPLDDIQSFGWLSTPAADLGHTVLFGALAAGRRLLVLGEEHALDAERLAAALQRHRIDALKLVPSHLGGLLQALDNPPLPRRCLILGGEAAGSALLERVRALAPQLTLLNHYGPTETTVGVLTHRLDAGAALPENRLPLGRPLANVCAYVLDADLNPLPPGIAGELYLGGAQLARGYLGRPDLTAERFLPDPFGMPGARLYRSGDQARLRADGRLDYLGRVDEQLKIRGYRVEPGELAEQLRREPGVRDAAVIAEGVPPRLIGYVAADAGFDLAALKQRLAQRLPDYLLPAQLVLLERLPLNANGKLDRRALPSPDAVPTGARLAPRNAVEATLAAIWCEVLKLETVGVEDNFFELGGDSILALQIIARARARKLRLTPKQLFEHQTIAALAARLGASSGEPAATPIARVPRDRPLPLSFAQQRLWFLQQLEPDSAAYNVPGLLRIDGELDVAALQAAFAALLERHEVLRTRLEARDDGVVQHAEPAEEAKLDWSLRDLSTLSPEQREAEAQRLADEDAARPFDLAQDRLLRLTLLRLAPTQHRLLLTLHHIVSDGWSIDRLLHELAECYAAQRENRPPALPPLPIQYADYAQWQRERLAGPVLQRELAYWTQQLGGGLPALELPTDRPRPARPGAQGARHRFGLDAGLTAQLRRLAQEQGATLFMSLLAVFDVLLHRLSGQGDVRVGVPIAGRPRLELEPLIGCFVNTQVLRARLHGGLGFLELLAQVKDTALAAQAHAELPFERLVDTLQPERDLSRSPLFDVLFNLQRPDYSGLQRIPGLRLEAEARDAGTAQFDLALDIKETGETLDAQFSYRCELFDAGTIARYAACYQELLRAVVSDPQRRLGELSLLPADEYRRVTADWNATATEYPDLRPVHKRIAAQAAATPEAIALVFEGQALSYRALDAAANCLAQRLIAEGVKPDSRVGLCAERSLELVIGLLAVLKAGAAYVPLDPDYPRERLAHMLDDAGIGLLLTQSALWSRLELSRVNLRVLALDADPGRDQPSDAPALVTHPQQLAYLIYTSGSTGQPKGAGLPHAGLINRLLWMQQAYPLTAADRVLQKTPFSFDVSVWEFLWPLLQGATLVVAAPGLHKDPAALAEVIRREQISTLHFVPSMLQAFVDAGELPSCPSLRQVMASGEALPAPLAARFREQTTAVLHNLYGPTEASIDVTAWTCSEADTRSVPIGRPIANTQIHLLDAQLNPVPIGVAGELYIGGAQLARGYHARPALTAERFVPDPYGPPGSRLYRSGDLARWREDGAIDYLGRIDHQMKLRGLRIELGEIEAALLGHPALREAVVLAREDRPGDQRLVAYVVGASPSAEELRRHLQLRLPDYMIPSAFVTLAALPLSPNGKLDRKALPAPELQTNEHSYIAPRTPQEAELARIWAEVLNLPRVGVHDNFFALGGDSILALQVVNRARRAGLGLTPRDLFQRQTVAELAQVVVATGAAAEAGPAEGVVPLTPIQAWFFEPTPPEPQHWNQALLLQPRQPLEANALQQALAALVRHHDALRLRFRRDAEGQWRQAYAPVDTPPPQLQVLDLGDVSDEGLQAQCTGLQQGLDLAQGPLLSAALLRLGRRGERLLIAIHHLVVDGVSWRLLLEDLQAAYRQCAAGVAVELPPRSSAYRSWAEGLQRHAASAALRSELGYWQQALPAVSLPAPASLAALRVGMARRIERRLSAERTQQLLQPAQQAYRTQINDLLLAALARVLCRRSGHDHALIELEGHGREDLGDGLDLSRSVGWYTSRFPVCLTPAGAPGASIKAVKEQLRAIPRKGLGYGVLRYLGDGETRMALAALPQPEISFNYLGQLDGSFASGLFGLAPEAPGVSIAASAPRRHALEIGAQVVDGSLVVSWTYSLERHAPQDIEALAQAYVEELDALVRHCLESEGDVTPSDFPDLDLAADDLDRLLEDAL